MCNLASIILCSWRSASDIQEHRTYDGTDAFQHIYVSWSVIFDAYNTAAVEVHFDVAYLLVLMCAAVSWTKNLLILYERLSQMMMIRWHWWELLVGSEVTTRVEIVCNLGGQLEWWLTAVRAGVDYYSVDHDWTLIVVTVQQWQQSRWVLETSWTEAVTMQL